MHKLPVSQIAGCLVLSFLSAAMIIFHSNNPPLSDENSASPETSAVLSSAAVPATESETLQPQSIPLDIYALASWFAEIPDDPDAPIGTLTPEILRFIPDETLRDLALFSISDPVSSALEVRKVFYDATGMTPLALLDTLEKNPDFVFAASKADEAADSAADAENDNGSIGNLVFTGDFNLGEDFPWCPVNQLAENTQVSDFLLSPLDGLLSGADVCCVNLECTISDRGTPTPNKLYTFRGKPENLRLLNEIGCDIVSLANNHVHDYGTDAMLDTISYLDEAGILSVGAGENLAEAMQYESVTVNGVKIGFVAASNAEKYRLTPSAADDTPGILAMYDPAAMFAAVKNASRECDYVVCVVHWGTENSTVVNDNQRELAAEFVRLGADAIIGHHPHVLQETEIMDGVPIAYSLGNFWFNTSPNDTAVAEILLSWDDSEIVSDLVMHPCQHVNGITYLTDLPSD